MRMRDLCHSLPLTLCLLATSPAAAEPQAVAGIAIDHPVPFERLKSNVEQERQRRTSTEWGTPASSLEAYQASIPTWIRWTGASGAVEIVKARFGGETALDLDAMARHKMTDRTKDPRVATVSQSMSATRVSGREARRLVFELDVNGWTIFDEALLIHDPGENTVLQIQAYLMRRFLAALFVERDRRYPKSVLDNVRLIESPN
jgi:hypothetical protein